MILLIGLAIAFFVVPDAWTLPVAIGAVVLEVTETFITLKISRRGRIKVGPELIVGSEGRAVTDCRPRGTVRIRGEAWQARCDAGVDAGDAVRVIDREQLVLVVEPMP